MNNEPLYDHIDVEGKRRHCTICNTATSITTDEPEMVELLAWQFDRIHQHKGRRPN